MIGQRLAAVVIAAALIVGAILVRAQIDDSGGDDADVVPATLVCAAELRSVCDQLADLGIDIATAEAGVTLDRLTTTEAAPPLWVTFDPFPGMADLARRSDGRAPLGLTVEALATSPIALVTFDDVAVSIADGCGTEPTAPCLTELELSVGFARSTDSASGLLGLTQAVRGYASAGGVPVDDARFERWFRDLVGSVPTNQLSGGTAIATLLSRPSAMDVAVGPEAMLPEAKRADFAVAYAAPMMRADVVLAVAPGADVPDGLVDRLRSELTGAGWAASGSDGAVPDPATAAAVRALWEELR